ncbi:MAG TPA: hypothetical protein VMI33_12475 [Streptosporangiaceae bacterium]|nr:hypothetical protein [Streptosporangiaceae bacterium]
MSIHQDGDEIFMVPVPKSQLTAVYRVLADPVTEHKALARAEETIEVPGQGAWTASMVRHLEADLKIPAVRTLITLVAQRAPAPMTFQEAVEATGTEVRLLRAQVGSLTKTTKRLFGPATWPMSVRYGEAGDAIYSMLPTVAEWWIEATGRSG